MKLNLQGKKHCVDKIVNLALNEKVQSRGHRAFPLICVEKKCNTLLGMRKTFSNKDFCALPYLCTHFIFK
jgi:hypothetical protein